MPQYQMNEMEKKLVAALRSGKYKQGRSYLRVGDRYCCLGVACDLMVQEGMGEWLPPSDSDEDVRQIDIDGAFVFRASGDQEDAEQLVQWMRDRMGWISGVGDVAIESRDAVDSLAGYNDVDSLAGYNDGGLTFDQIADIIEAGLVIHQGDLK